MQQNVQEIDTVHYVTTESQDVFINMSGIKEITMEVIAYLFRNYANHNFTEVIYEYVRLSSDFHPKKYDNRAADWLFVLNSLNFALWVRNDAPEWKVEGLTGYMALCAAIKRAIDDGKPMWDPNFYTKLSIAEMKCIFTGDNNIIIPRLGQRMMLLRKVGKILLNNYNGTFANCIKSCNHDAIKLVVTVHNIFPSYRDVSIYNGRSVRLYNKAWILVSDIWSFFHHNRDHELHIDMNRMKFPTIFVDYRVSQVFTHFNILIYSKKLLDEMKKGDKLLTQGSREELEIRCCSLMIVRYLHKVIIESCELYVKRMPELSVKDFDCTCLIDNFLWDYQQICNEQLKKHALCKVFTEQY